MTTRHTGLTAENSGSTVYGQRMRFGVLGPVEAFEKRKRLSIGGPKQRTVLALLIARAGAPISTDALIDGVYGDEPPQGARRSLQTYVSNLRSEIGHAIEATGSGYVLKVDRSDVDALRFEDAIVEATTLDDPEIAAEMLKDALALWRGHAYADVDGLVSLTTERTRLSELRMSAIEMRVDKDLERGHHRQLIGELDALTDEHPLRERFRGQQMLALYRCGRQAEALRAYEKTRSYLVDQMGLDPSRDLKELEQRILDQDPTLGFDTGPTVRTASILVADVADATLLSVLDPVERTSVVAGQSDAITDGARDNAGDVFAHRGTAIYVSFTDVEHAVSAAVATQQALGDGISGMRIGISVGEVQTSQDDAVQGPPVTRAVRLAGAAHGGQVLISSEANQALAESGGAGWIVRSLGRHDVDRSGENRLVYQLMVDGLERNFPSLRTELPPIALPVESRGLPGYELREQVGSGAFGVVHRAYQPSVGREVAIKIIRPEYANDLRFIRLFEVEAQLVARLEHPHIVPLHDYWRNPDGAYLAMRWLGGGTLNDRVNHDRLSISEANRILADIGPALAFAHRRGVIHRDVKLSNVLLDEEGEAYLTDFGIASDITLDSVGSVAQDVRALAVLIAQCVGESDEPAVAHLLTEAISSEAFADVQSFMAAWERAIGVAETASPVVGYTPTRNPYRGLSAFGELDAADFHGRDAEIEEIVATLSEHRLVAVVGPSGIGKSSIVRAGLVPALRSGTIPGSDEWLITDMRPGTYPYEELASALMRVAAETPNDLEDELRRDARGLVRSAKRYVSEGQTVLLVVDQFEELFTMSSRDDREAFLATVATTVDDQRSNLRIVITVRADFFDRPLRYADLGTALRAGTIPISAPSDEGIHAIVSEPAADVGVAFEPGLVDRIVGDVNHQPGALPLLEFALTELFEKRDSDRLTLDDYVASGGVLGALGRRAEATYSGLDTYGREASREMFLRLVSVSENGRDTRRRVRFTDLERIGINDVVLRDTLNAFGDHRLLTFDSDAATRGPTVEVAHEAILTEWPRLVSWVDEHREDLVLRSRLAAAVSDWETDGRSETYLLGAGRLEQHESWTANTELSLTSGEEEFLVASRTAQDHRTARRRRTRRLVTAGFGTAAIVAVVLATAALIARNDARDQADQAVQSELTARASEESAQASAAAADAARESADDATSVALSRELALQSLQQLSIDPERSILLAIEAIEVGRQTGADLPEAVTALHQAVQQHRIVARHTGGDFVAVSPDGHLIATAHNGGDVALLSVATGSVDRVLEREGATAKGVAFSSDGELLSVIYGGVESPVRIWDLGTRQHVDLVGGSLPESDSPPWKVIMSADGTLVVGGSFGGVARVWDVTSGEHQDIPVVGDVDLNPLDNSVVAADDETGLIRSFDSLTGIEFASFAVDGFSPQNISVSPDGTRVALVSAFDGVVAVYDLASGEEVSRAELDRPQGQVSWSESGLSVLVGGDGGVPRVIDARTGAVHVDLLGHSGIVWATATTPNDLVVVTAGLNDASTLVWTAEEGVRPEVLNLATGVPRLRNFAYVGTGDSIFVAGRGDPGTVMTIDAETADPVLVLENQIVGFGLETHPIGDGSFGATVDVDGSSSVVSLLTGETSYVAPQGSFVKQMTLGGDRLLLSDVLPSGEGGSATVILEPESGDSVPVAGALFVFGADFSPDGSLLRIWDGGDYEVFYDTATGQESFRLDAFKARFIQPGGHLAVIDNQGVLHVADLEMLVGGATLDDASMWQSKAHDSFTPVLVSNGDGSLIMTAGFGESAKVWDATDGSLVTELEYGLTTGSARGAFHPQGGRVTLLSDGGRLLTFTLDTDELLGIARSRLTRDLTDAECQTYLHQDSCTAR